MQVVRVSGMARSQRDAKHVFGDHAIGKCAQEVSVQTAELGALRLPVLPNRDSKGAPNRRRCGRALDFGGRVEVEPNDVERVSKRVFAEPGGSIARLPARVGAGVHQPARRATVDLDRDLVHDRFEAGETLHERRLDEHTTRVPYGRARVTLERAGVTAWRRPRLHAAFQGVERVGVAAPAVEPSPG